ncbi:MAG: pimeloyl-CoA dehydrogenase small subunit, partial [Burkholderiales bacterium]|nr:pimeloyl-CoA dehydrogenase small subunit [Burkholderiales bacterium]
LPDAAERSRVVSGAKAYIGQIARRIGQEAMQMHGGIGLTDELMAAHLFKRLSLIETTFGDTDHHFERFARTVAA